MKIKSEHNFMILQLLQAANFGSASGDQTIDSPTQKNVFTGLPFIPNSSLKGVLKVNLKYNSTLNNQIQNVFGEEDDNIEVTDSNLKKPGNLVLGNGDMLAFPIQTANGQRCWIIPVGTLLKMLELGTLWDFSNLDIPYIANALYQGQNRYTIILNNNGLPRFEQEYELLDRYELRAEQKALQLFSQTLLKNYLPTMESWLLASDKLATELWKEATEIRTLTSLSKEKTALNQTLRRIELIPEGSLFVSFVSWLYDDELELPDDIIQVGGFENIGLGSLKYQILENIQLKEMERIELPNIKQHENIYYRTDIMQKAYKDILKISESKSDKLKKTIKSNINNFASRLITGSFETAISLNIAKAKLNQSNKKNEAESHFEFLKMLLDKEEDELGMACLDLFKRQLSQLEKQRYMQKLIWLRRYAEILLNNKQEQ